MIETPIFCGFQAWTADHIERLADAEFTHVVLQTYPLNKRVEECLLACKEFRVKPVVQPPTLAVPAVPPEWRYRSREGTRPVTDKRMFWNYAPSIWNAHAARFVRRHLRKLRDWCAKHGVDVAGLWASVGWEISLPRCLCRGADRFRLWTFDDYAKAAWERDHGPDAEMVAWWPQDIRHRGCAVTAWAFKSLVEYTRTLCSWGGPDWEAWLPIVSPGLNWLDPQSGIEWFPRLWLHYVTEYYNRTVWVIPCLYRRGVHSRNFNIASCSLFNRLYQQPSIVGVEGISGLISSDHLERARRDGFSGILMDASNMTTWRVPDIRAKIEMWDDLPHIVTPPMKRGMVFPRPDLDSTAEEKDEDDGE